MADSTFTLRVDAELKAAFAEVAAAQEHTAAQLIRLLMRDEVTRWREQQAHDAWFRAEVATGLSQAARDGVERRPHDAVATSWQRQREQLEQRGAGRTA